MHLPNTQIQPVKKDVVCHRISYVCHGSGVHLWQYYTLSTQTPDDVMSTTSTFLIRNVVTLSNNYVSAPDSADKSLEADVETLPEWQK